MRRCLKRATDLGGRLFRNNVGRAWTGKAEVIRSPRTVRVNQGDVLIREARPFHAGLAPGSADLVGWMPVEITPDMVGQSVAIFASVETKTARGRVADGQKLWAAAVDRAGGLAGIARTDADLDKILLACGARAQPVDSNRGS